MQARMYFSASIQFDQRQSNSKCRQELFECYGRILREGVAKSLLDSLKLKNDALEKKLGIKTHT